MRNCRKIFLLSVVFSRLLFAEDNSPQSSLSVIEARNRYTVENITVSNGLHNNYIFDVLQDHLGFLWLASDIGLQKYDGYSFTLYKPDSLDVASRKALRLYEDKNENLWVQMEAGLVRYRRELDDFVKYSFVNGNNDTIPYQVTAMAEDLDGMLCVWIQDKGLYRVDSKNKTLTPNDKINEWYRTILAPAILLEGNQKGIYETWVTFPARYYGSDLYFKFVIERNDGTLEWEPNPNPDDPSGYGNRLLPLSGDTLILPAVSFNSNMTNLKKSLKTSQQYDLKPTRVKFRLDLNEIENPLLKGEEVQVNGNRLPLTWGNNISVPSMVFDLENRLWIAVGSSGLVRFDLQTGNHEQFVADPGSAGSINSDVVNDAIRDHDGKLWFGSDRGLSRYSLDTDSFDNYFVDASDRRDILNHIFRMTNDEQGNIWTISNNVKGIGCFNKTKKEYIHYSKGMNAWISSVTTDRSGIVWTANWYQGIYKLDLNVKKFSAFSLKKNDKDILDGKAILAVCKDENGEIWFGGDLDGLYRYNRETGNVSTYKIKGGNFDSSVENYILDIFQDSKGHFWIGTRGGLCSFHPETGSFKHIQQPPSIYQGLGRAATIHEDTNGMLWIVTVNGLLVQFDPENISTESFTPDDRQVSFRDVIADEQGFLWIGSAVEGGKGAVVKFDISRKRMSYVKQFDNFNITSLCYDNGILWCSTNGSGLIRYDTKADTKTIIDTHDGLLSNSIMGLERDTSGNLWIGTPRGLTRYDPQKGTFNHYFKEDGFFTNEFTYTAHYKAGNGELIFGTMHGVVTFHPDSIKDSDYISPIVLIDFRIHNKPVPIDKDSPLKKHISVSDEITLVHDQNDISISFASLDFSHPERNRYSFYLENFEEDWRNPGLERTAYYTNLDPGEYVFKVKGTNSDGVWNEEPATLAITILPPWWKTWWAYSCYGFVVFGLLHTIRRYELGRQRLKFGFELERVESSKLREMDSLKSRFFANISHEFRTPLTLILGPIQKWKEHPVERLSGVALRSETGVSPYIDALHKDLTMMERNAQRLLRLINQLLDLSKLEAGAMKLQAAPGNIVTFVRGIAESFQSSGNERGISLQVHADQDDVSAYFDRDKMGKVLTNLLSNAFKFTPQGGRVRVSVQCHSERSEESDSSESLPGATPHHDTGVEGFATITVSDTGIGISQEELPRVFDRFYQVDASPTRDQQGSGIGLALTKELVELHHGAIAVQSEAGKGTTFVISLPLGRQHLNDDEVVSAGEGWSSKTQTANLEPESVQNSSEIARLPDGQASPLESVHRDDESSALVLVIEDSIDVRTYIRGDLAAHYNVLEASNGTEGLKTAQETLPDLIISDVMMPGMDGYEVCKRLKQGEMTSHIPVILLTAKAGQENKLEGLETGADDYLTKPFDTKELLARIHNLIELRRRLRERFSKATLLKPGEVAVTSLDDAFLQKVMAVVEAKLPDEDFGVDELAAEVAMSRSQLHRKLKALTGQTPTDFIRYMRLHRAMDLLKKNAATVSEIAYAVGFAGVSYFSKCFQEQFGQLPSEARKT